MAEPKLEDISHYIKGGKPSQTRPGEMETVAESIQDHSPELKNIEITDIKFFGKPNGARFTDVEMHINATNKDDTALSKEQMATISKNAKTEFEGLARNGFIVVKAEVDIGANTNQFTAKTHEGNDKHIGAEAAKQIVKARNLTLEELNKSPLYNGGADAVDLKAEKNKITKRALSNAFEAIDDGNNVIDSKELDRFAKAVGSTNLKEIVKQGQDAGISFDAKVLADHNNVQTPQTQADPNKAPSTSRTGGK